MLSQSWRSLISISSISVSLLLAGALLAAAGQIDMVTLHVDAFWVIGIEARTSNAGDDIGKSWKRLFSEGILNRIPNRVDSRIVAVYTDYESDKDGPYTYLLGAKVSSIDKLPAGMSAKKVMTGEYGMFTAESGPPAQLVVALWKQIWSLESGALRRAYKTDFEVYEEHNDPQNGRVDVYVGVKK
jgi:predicted transcriptional regulator YdeE